ncbi:hypothetical protein ACFVMC_01595 [Nocardia sp. NPDC127579]|uniref:hypothetical protein n=1 Tax=Nocardia sp. NPDC127579 TaxID=3345402 RepID=UPI0036329AAF
MAEANVDDILTAGNRGLEYWRQFHPHFVKLWPGECQYTVAQLVDRYHEQQGMNLVKLNTTLEALKKAKTVADQEITSQRNVVGRLPNVWSGNASSNAQKMIWEQIGLAEADVTKLQTAINAIGTFINDTKTAVDTKAEFTLALLKEVWVERVAVEWKTGQNFSGLEVKIDGKDADAVAKMIDIRNAKEWLSYDQICWVYDNFPETKSLMDDPVRKTYKDGEMNKLDSEDLANAKAGNYDWKVNNAEIAQTAVNRWLDTVFKSDFSGKLSKYVQMCTDVDTLIASHYTTMKNSLDPLDRDAYPQPAGTPSSPAPSAPGPSPASPSPTSPSPTTPSPTTPSPTAGVPTSGTPVSGTPSFVNTALSGLASALTTALSSAATAMTTLASSGLTTLTSTISEAIEDLTEEVKNGNTDGEKKGTSAEFTIDGKQYKLEVGADGQPKLVETSPDGKTHEYSVKLDANGNPIISDEEKTSEPGTPSTGTPNAGTPNTGTPNTGSPPSATPTPNVTVPPAATKKATEDGEHTPKTAPVAGEQQPAPVQTGAELSEAGPL